MNTLRQLAAELPTIPTRTSWYLAELAEAIRRQSTEFSVSDLQRACPGVSLDMIRHLLDRQRKEKKVKCLGIGRNARWQNLGN